MPISQWVPQTSPNLLFESTYCMSYDEGNTTYNRSMDVLNTLHQWLS